MALVRWNPIGTLAGMEIDRLNRMFADLQTEAFNQAWVPAVDIFETDAHEVVIKAELPDMKKEDIGVTVREQRPHADRRAQAGRVRAARAVPARGAPLRELQPLVHAAGLGRRRPDRRVLQGRRADHSAPAPRRGEAEADLRQHRITSETVGWRAPSRIPVESVVLSTGAQPARSRPEWRGSAVSATLAACRKM